MTESTNSKAVFTAQLDFIAKNMIAPHNMPTILKDELRESLIKYNKFDTSNWFNTSEQLSLTEQIANLNNIEEYKPLPIIYDNTNKEYKYLTVFNTPEQDSPIVIESLNFSHLLLKLSSGVKHGFGDGNKSPLLDLMNCLHVTLYTLHETNLKKLKSNIRFSVKLYEINKTNMTYDTTEDIRKYVAKIIPDIDRLDETSSNIEVIKRVIRGYILVIHTHIVLKAYKIEDESNALFETTAGILLKENERFLNQNVTNVTQYDELSFIDQHYRSRELHQKISDYETQYDNGIKIVGDQEEVIENEKSRVSFQEGNVTQKKNKLRRESTIHNVFLTLFVIFIITLFGILGTSQQSSEAVEQFELKTVVGVIFLFSVASLIIIYTINNKLFEQFTTNNTTETVKVTMVEKAFEKYLENTINLGLLVDTNMRYGDIVHRLHNEIDDNHNTGVQLKLNKESLKDNQTYDHRKSKILKERVLLFLQLLIILSAVVFIHLNTKDIDVFLSIILIVLSLISVYFYIIRTSSFVNTDPTKIYWKKPPTSMLY